jgi:hypothetical protein
MEIPLNTHSNQKIALRGEMSRRNGHGGDDATTGEPAGGRIVAA